MFVYSEIETSLFSRIDFAAANNIRRGETGLVGTGKLYFLLKRTTAALDIAASSVNVGTLARTHLLNNPKVNGIGILEYP